MMGARDLEEQSLLEWGRAREKVLALLDEHITTTSTESLIWDAICDYEKAARERSRCAAIWAVMQTGEK